MIEAQRPKGDSFGTLGETVVAGTLRPGELMTLRQRQIALVVLCLGALIILLDSSVVNVALPSIQRDLGFSQASLAWVVNGYLIPFGGLLLFGGRLGDLIGAKRVFIGGLGLFTAASLACGLAQTEAMLIAARFSQGVGGALAASVVLAMIVDMFPKPQDQTKALAFYAFVAASGAALGLIAGAVLVQLNWHWIFFVNVPIGIGALLAARRTLPRPSQLEDSDGLDTPGALLVIAGLMLAVYTIVRTADHGWAATSTIALGSTAIVLLALFAGWQLRASRPLVPLAVLRARNVAWPNVVLALLVIGPHCTFFLGTLYMRQVLGYSALEVGFTFLPVTVAIAVVTLKATPRLFKHLDPRSVLLIGLPLLAIGLGWLGRVSATGGSGWNMLPGLLLIGLGTGLGLPAALTTVLAGATSKDSGIRSGLANTTQQLGGALSLSVLASVSAEYTKRSVRHGHALPWALSHGYELAYELAVAVVLVAIVVTWLTVKPATPETAPTELDPTRRGVVRREVDLTGAIDPDFLALGMSGTNMMAMLWSVALGRTAVGVELRGDPVAAQMHWNIREEIYHQLAEIDRLIVERYGPERIPTLSNGEPFLLHRCFYSTDPDSAGDARADEVLSGFIPNSHIAGVVRQTVRVDDRRVAGKPARTIQTLGPVQRPEGPDASQIGRPMSSVLAERSTFQVGAQELLFVLRRYLRAMERMDLAAGLPPRCRLFTYHRVVVPRKRRTGRWSWLPNSVSHESDGFVAEPDGRRRIRIEAITELDGKRSYRRVRAPGTEVIDLGVPELFVIAEGVGSDDAARLGFRQEPMLVDHQDGRGPIPAEADYLLGLLTMYVDSCHRYRISSEFDNAGNEYWVRQVMIGHEDDAENAWIAVEVPDFMTFDPIAAGIAPPGSAIDSREYFGGFHHLVQQYFLDQSAIITGLPRWEVARTSMAAVPMLVTVKARIGVDARVAVNGVVAGDSFGNADFLTSCGANTGMIGHGYRVARYWQARTAGASPEQAITELAHGIKQDTADWLELSRTEFRQPAQSSTGIEPARRQQLIEATRKLRRSVDPVENNDQWSRITLFVGRLYSYPLPDIPEQHDDATVFGPGPIAGPELGAATGGDDREYARS